MCFISFIIPCYNVEPYLPRCIKSLENQKIKDGCHMEFIFINDGFTDNTLSILKEFIAREGRTKPIDQPNKGVSAARNAGFKEAKGKYVFFLDSDDWLTEDASQILYEVCNSGQPDIIISNAYTVNEKTLDIKKEWNPCVGIDSGLYDKMDFARQVRKLPISFKAYRREMLVKNNICYDEDLRVGEVYTFFLNAMTFSRQIAFTDKRIMNYLVRDSGVTLEYFKQFFNAIMQGRTNYGRSSFAGLLPTGRKNMLPITIGINNN